MIDIRAARNDPAGFRAALARKGDADAAALDELLEADARWRELETRATELRTQTKLKGKPSPEQLEQVARLKEELKLVEQDHADASRRRDELLAVVPNPPADDVPDGATEDDAVVLREVGDR